jgi:hypothetical protein
VCKTDPEPPRQFRRDYQVLGDDRLRIAGEDVYAVKLQLKLEQVAGPKPWLSSESTQWFAPQVGLLVRAETKVVRESDGAVGQLLEELVSIRPSG